MNHTLKDYTNFDLKSALESAFTSKNGDRFELLLNEAHRRLDLNKSDMDKATEIPMDNCCVKINVGSDGTWMHFRSTNGQQCSFNMENMAEDHIGITKSALGYWCEDRRTQAKVIKKQSL